MVVQWLRLYPPNAGGLDSIPGQGNRSHMLQLKILCSATKTWHSQINNQTEIEMSIFFKNILVFKFLLQIALI